MDALKEIEKLAVFKTADDRSLDQMMTVYLNETTGSLKSWLTTKKDLDKFHFDSTVFPASFSRQGWSAALIDEDTGIQIGIEINTELFLDVTVTKGIRHWTLDSFTHSPAREWVKRPAGWLGKMIFQEAVLILSAF